MPKFLKIIPEVPRDTGSVSLAIAEGFPPLARIHDPAQINRYPGPYILENTLIFMPLLGVAQKRIYRDKPGKFLPLFLPKSSGNLNGYLNP